MISYFSQFGKLTKVRLSRSRKTGERGSQGGRGEAVSRAVGGPRGEARHIAGHPQETRKAMRFWNSRVPRWPRLPRRPCTTT